MLLFVCESANKIQEWVEEWKRLTWLCEDWSAFLSLRMYSPNWIPNKLDMGVPLYVSQREMLHTRKIIHTPSHLILRLLQRSHALITVSQVVHE